MNIHPPNLNDDLISFSFLFSFLFLFSFSFSFLGLETNPPSGYFMHFCAPSPRWLMGSRS